MTGLRERARQPEPCSRLPRRALRRRDDLRRRRLLRARRASSPHGPFIFDPKDPRILANLEDFVIFKDGRRIQDKDFNFWGVTFDGDSGRFYATLATGHAPLPREGRSRREARDRRARRRRVPVAVPRRQQDRLQGAGRQAMAVALPHPRPEDREGHGAPRGARRSTIRSSGSTSSDSCTTATRSSCRSPPTGRAHRSSSSRGELARRSCADPPTESSPGATHARPS